MRASNDAVFNAMLQSIGGKVETSLELMRLNASERKQRGGIFPFQLPQVREVGLNVLINDARFDCVTLELRSVMLRRYGSVALGMNPRRNLCT